MLHSKDGELFAKDTRLEDHGHCQKANVMCFGNEGSKICNPGFYSNASISSIHTSSGGQCRCLFIFSKDGWGVLPTNFSQI